MMELVPYSFSTAVLPSRGHTPALPGQAQGVYITLTSADVQFILTKIMAWFREREEVELVDYGISDKQGLGYLLLEWDECKVDQLFCDILRDEEIVADYTLYIRDL